ncbi:Transcriptional regulatory protein Sin3-like protein [Pleurotus pulmonarius]
MVDTSEPIPAPLPPSPSSSQLHHPREDKIPQSSFLPFEPSSLQPESATRARSQELRDSVVATLSGASLSLSSFAFNDSDSGRPIPPLLTSSRSGSPTMRAPKSRTPRPNAMDGMRTPSGVQPSPEPGRPLDVTDALSYLDAVKVQFQEKPDVYNRFLDIMKDFKSQVIDTPGVIERVSMLFHGNPELIQGFNTFLPVGYRIDVSADPMDPNLITVTTPSGTTTQSTTSFAQIPSGSHGIGSLVHPSIPFPGQPQGSGAPGSRSMTPQQYHVVQGQSPADPSYSTGTTAAASFLGTLNGKGDVERRQGAAVSGEFHHAIEYLNKIKARFSDDANTYKQFLDILQSYQKEQRKIEESQVYVQVQMLFKDAPDLLAEFKDFLPEVGVGGALGSNAIGLMPAPGHPDSPWAQPSAADKSKKRIPGVQPKRKRRTAEKEPTPVPVPLPPKPAQNRSKKPKHNHKDPDSPVFSPYAGPASPQLSAIPPPMGMPPSQLSAQSIHPHHHASSHVLGHGTATSPDKLLFFDRAKKALENREIYEEFLKLLSLFSKDVIDSKTLIEHAQVFLGDGDLMAEFKELIGWDAERGIENGPPGSIRTGPPEALSALPVDDGEGPSYRRLPDSEVRLACSGRDELCRSVLNDAWASHPTWASEDSGFVAHKKNTFEEALHKSEEERHEYHVHLEALKRTISLFEPVAARLEGMTPEERSTFKLKANFGGPSKCLYHRTIRKIYGRDAGAEVIQALQDCPSVSVPVVLARLKQKDDEWRRAQREWSRTWREVDAKNFYKSLDHQGISFKQNDKKAITAKYFVADIESLKAQQMEAQKNTELPAFTRGSVGYQIEYDFQDISVLHDSLKMVYSFLDHSQGTYTPQERRGAEKFLRSFVPLLCRYPAAEFNEACGPLDGAADDDNSSHDLSGPGEPQRNKKANPPSNAVTAGDLRKKLLKSAQEKISGRDSKGSSAVGSRAASPAASSVASRADDELKAALGDHAEDVWIRASTSSPQGIEEPPTMEGGRPIFANTTFYTLLRLLQLLYSRLLTCKLIGTHLAAEKHRPLLANPVAAELGLDDPNGPSAVLAQAMEAMGEQGVAEGSNVVYMYLLDACEKVFDGELDQSTFEEHMRWFFGNKAYHVFTLDKLITALVKQVHTILSDNKCQELWTLLQYMQAADTLTNRDIVRYRREAERHVGQDDHLYKIKWEPELKMLRMQLIGADDPSVDGGTSMVHRWREYVDTYVMHYPTEWLPETKEQGQSSAVFLRRNLRASDETPSHCTNGTVIRIGLPTYKLMYEFGTEDWLMHVWCAEELATLRERARARHEERKRCRWLQQ